ncbi:HAD-like protein [Tothia fuscella]|uniref:HAD-like protein n=1 Tax=Tothia fuscella TaxID=1048955 RepID=A0A9P4P1Q7_9PEZI|nr:HAD-like protein [Tothia fuscella]
MFGEMRSALGIAKSVDILDHVYSLPKDQQEEAMAKIRDIERNAMSSQTPQAGLIDLMNYVDSRGVRKGICTRNFDMPVNHLIETFMQGHRFSPIITREFRPSKPDPAGILHIASTWGLPDAANLIMVGDSIDDMTAGYRAGAATVLLVNEVNAHLATHEHTDLCIRRLDELVHVLENGFVGVVGQGEDSVDAKGLAEEALKRN